MSEKLEKQIGDQVKFMVTALIEGGLDRDRPEIRAAWNNWFALVASDQPPKPMFSASNGRGLRLTVTLESVDGQDFETGTVARLACTIAEDKPDRAASIEFSRESDRPYWKVRTVGTSSLMTSHPLSQLTYRDEWLGLSVSDVDKRFDDREVERLLMEVAHRFEHANI
ncbi:hypothetical protein IT087_00900 [Candidatus Uhrbacteria bacterium]|nr:hypothetical protein [Candidatus Uhrbacteria bacterium]